MPNRTFAFSHRGGYWKTRYSFFSNCYAFINKVFLSFRVTMGPTQRQPVWRHNIGPFTNFYGDAAGAGLAVSFNQKPSENKILKSISVEGTNNCDPASILVANNSTGNNQAKESPVIAFDDKGGILYGQIQGQNTNTNGNVRYMGSLLLTDLLSQFINEGSTLTIQAPFIWASGGGSNISTSTKYLVRSAGSQLYSSSPNAPVDVTNNYNLVPDNIQYLGAVDDVATFLFNDLGSEILLPILGGQVDTLHVYTVSENATYGDMIKGQYADAVFTFPAADWELLSVNLEYEPTTYDHSAAANMPSRGGGRRRRRRR